MRSKTVLLAEASRLDFDGEIPPWGKVMFHVFSLLLTSTPISVLDFSLTIACKSRIFSLGLPLLRRREVFYHRFALNGLEDSKLFARSRPLLPGRKLRCIPMENIAVFLCEHIYRRPAWSHVSQKLDMWYAASVKKPIS